MTKLAPDGLGSTAASHREWVRRLRRRARERVRLHHWSHNVDSFVERVKAAGRSVALDKMQVPGVGRLVYAKDPEGNIFGMLQSDAR